MSTNNLFDVGTKLISSHFCNFSNRSFSEDFSRVNNRLMNLTEDPFWKQDQNLSLFSHSLFGGCKKTENWAGGNFIERIIVEKERKIKVRKGNFLFSDIFVLWLFILRWGRGLSIFLWPPITIFFKNFFITKNEKNNFFFQWHFKHIVISLLGKLLECWLRVQFKLG